MSGRATNVNEQAANSFRELAAKGVSLTPYPKGIPKGRLTSAWFTRQWGGSEVPIQACADRHEAHILPKSQGHYIWLIKLPLMIVLKRLPGAIATPDPDDGRFFGKAMEYNVLQYKRIMKLVNHDYQNQADNIVGIMTIRALDFHIRFIEDRVPGWSPGQKGLAS